MAPPPNGILSPSPSLDPSDRPRARLVLPGEDTNNPSSVVVAGDDDGAQDVDRQRQSEDDVEDDPDKENRIDENVDGVEGLEVEEIEGEELEGERGLFAELPSDSDAIDLPHKRIKDLGKADLKRFGENLQRLLLRQNEIKRLTIKERHRQQPDPSLSSSSNVEPSTSTTVTTVTTSDPSTTSATGTETAVEQPSSSLPSSSSSRRVSVFEGLDSLEELDLYDNRISEIEGVDGLGKLWSLDLSFNLIKQINNHLTSPQSKVKLSLTHLFLIQNKIHKIENLDGFEKLEYLELGGNRIRTIENLAPLSTTLTQLWLGKNKISSLSPISCLINLRVLSIQSNRITSLSNSENNNNGNLITPPSSSPPSSSTSTSSPLAPLVNLEELYISHNGLKVLEGLEGNKKLKVLDVAGNFLESVKEGALDALGELEDFWANDNRFSTLDSIPLTPEKHPKLETIYLERNPLQKEEGTAYRRKIMLMLPQVRQIDATHTR